MKSWQVSKRTCLAQSFFEKHGLLQEAEQHNGYLICALLVCTFADSSLNGR